MRKIKEAIFIVISNDALYTRAKVNPFSFAVVFTVETIRVQKAVDIFPQTAIYHKNRRLFQPLYKFSTIGTEKALCYKDFIYLSVCTRDSKTTVSTCPVIGNRSHGCTRSTWYPCAVMYFRSLANVAESQLT